MLKILGIYILVISITGVGITLLKIPKEYQKINRGEYNDKRRSNIYQEFYNSYQPY